MKFNYIVRTQQGEVQNGTIEAPNQATALKTLQDRNFIIVKIQAVEKAPLFVKEIKLFQRVKRKEAFIFFRQLAILVEANIPLIQSLRAIGQQFENAYFVEIIFKVANDVDGGMSFSKALAKHPKIFSPFLVNLIKAGEVSGQLHESLIYLADHLEREYYLISKVRGAMAYPIFILSAFVIVGVLVMVMVIPQLTAILLETGQELPLSTRIVIAVSDFLRNHGLLMLLILTVFSVFFGWYKKTKQGKLYWDTLKLKLPIFGKVLQKTYLAQVADSLSALVRGGVSIIQSLNISGQIINNVIFQEIIWQARDEVKSGRSVSAVLERYYEQFPPLFCQMIKTGEKTGQIDDILEKLSDFYNKEVENVVNTLSQLIEPILIILLGIGVAILIFAVFMPIYNLARVM